MMAVMDLSRYSHQEYREIQRIKFLIVDGRIDGEELGVLDPEIRHEAEIRAKEERDRIAAVQNGFWSFLRSCPSIGPEEIWEEERALEALRPSDRIAYIVDRRFELRNLAGSSSPKPAFG